MIEYRIKKVPIVREKKYFARGNNILNVFKKRCHSRVGGTPLLSIVPYRGWIPAHAGMTPYSEQAILLRVTNG